MTRFNRGGELPDKERELKDGVPVYSPEEAEERGFLQEGSLKTQAIKLARKKSQPITIGEQAYVWYPENNEYVYTHETVSWDPVEETIILSQPLSDTSLTTWDELFGNTLELQSIQEVQGYFLEIYLTPKAVDQNFTGRTPYLIVIKNVSAQSIQGIHTFLLAELQTTDDAETIKEKLERKFGPVVVMAARRE